MALVLCLQRGSVAMVAKAISQPSNGLLTVQEFALASIQKHFHKSIKHEEEVRADEDPEPLHQMRVGMRRLRTALTVFAPFVDLSPQLERDVAHISQRLGNVRDLDVLGQWVDNCKATAHLVASESQCLEVATSDLARRRRKHAKRMLKILKGHRYSRVVAKLQQWLEQPHFQASAEWPMALVLPDLLSPLVNRLLLHPGWLTVIAQPLHPTAQVGDLRNTQIECDLNRYGGVLHDLRKQFKRVRYQTEFFVSFYDADYAKQTEEFKVLQDLLGELHDSQVQGEFLENTLGRAWPEDLPSVSDRLQKERSDLWRQWLPLQQKYLNPVFRDQLRALVLHPQSNENSRPLAS